MQTSLFLTALDYLVLDVETRRSSQDVGGWHLASEMGVSIAVVYDSRTDGFTAYTQDTIPAMAEQLASGPVVVGFNTAKFDYTVLAPHAPTLSFKDLPTLDILLKVFAELGHRLTLDNLATTTLKTQKSADGMAALRWWKEQRLDLIEEYCRMDVALTRDLYLFGRKNGYLLYTTREGQEAKVPVSWA